MDTTRYEYKPSLRRTAILLIVVAALAILSSVHVTASDHRSRLSLGIGALYEKGFDATLSYEYETSYHNAWEFFGNYYFKWDECESCGHVCPESFWKNYRTWGVGAAYKPCVWRGRNSHGNLRIGGSLGSDLHKVLGGVHLGYEHDYALRGGWQLFWQVKTDFMIKGEDWFRTGVVLGVKLPL